jgi:hypothetical protein
MTGERIGAERFGRFDSGQVSRLHHRKPIRIESQGAGP